MDQLNKNRCVCACVYVCHSVCVHVTNAEFNEINALRVEDQHGVVSSEWRDEYDNRDDP